jgi:tetrahydrodipicolinate N-succinyltransferase
MGLVVKPVTVEDGAWVGAFARIAPGVTVGREAVVTLGSVLLRDAEARGVYIRNPAVRVRERTIRDRPGLDGASAAGQISRWVSAPARQVRRVPVHAVSDPLHRVDERPKLGLRE